MMYKKIGSLMFAVCLIGCLHAQTTDTGMSVHKNGRIDQMVKKQFTGVTATAAQQAAHPAAKYKEKRRGYRIMVLNTNDRELAYKTKGQLLSRYPDQQVYMSYQAPFFKLKMGDFTVKSEAENIRNDLVKTMPKGVFLVSEMVIVTVNPEEDAKL